MNEKEKIRFYDTNIEDIFSVKSNKFIELIDQLVNDEDVREAFRTWPNNLKIRIVDKYLIEIENTQKDQFDINTWDEFYEMYDGKFDEHHMLHITIFARYKNEIEDLGI